MENFRLGRPAKIESRTGGAYAGMVEGSASNRKPSNPPSQGLFADHCRIGVLVRWS